MNLDELTQLIERDLPGWGWLVRNTRGEPTRTDNSGEPRPDWVSGRYFANITSPSFHYSNATQRDSKTGERHQYVKETGEQTSFPRYSDISAVDALMASYVWAIEVRENGGYVLPSERRPLSETPGVGVAVGRDRDRFSGLLADGRPEMPDGYSAEIEPHIVPSRRHPR